MSEKMTPGELLQLAGETIAGDRQDDYGDADESFERIRQFWSTLLGVEILPWQVALMMTLLKVSRTSTSPHKLDNWVDMASYPALGASLGITRQNEE